MIDHMSTYTVQFDRSRAFYEAVFVPLGYSVQMEFVAEWNENFPTQRNCAFGPEGKPIFWLIETKEKATPTHIAFSAKNREDVNAFYKIGMENGGEDNGAPGLRPMYHENYYGAFLFDPEGNNVEAVCHKAES